MESSIFLPRGGAAVPVALRDALLNDPDVIARITLGLDAGALRLAGLRQIKGRFLAQYTDEELEAAARAAYEMAQGAALLADETESEASFRAAESTVLGRSVDSDELTVVPMDVYRYSGGLNGFFTSINLVERLRETRALTGFSRVLPEAPEDAPGGYSELWLQPPRRNERWLPAYCVYGEGLFFRLNEERLARWEKIPAVLDRVAKLRGFHALAQQQRALRERELSPRFVLVHTLAHLLMNQLTFECGYSSAALRERLYVSGEDEKDSAAFLIYTAAGDAEGTLGGLVRMGKPGYLEGVIRDAVAGARWCGADPVCMEIGSTTGQGPDSCNLAACHSCGLVPETACEEFNRFLDRGLLVGDLSSTGTGFFTFDE